ncbi:MAG: U32 family peptidase [Oscillatoriales cyanobacterium C42_A2020_001]|nr:U32 family peptidase [Leptolyngbyaceae cyanobacterium C42_A2020_001]
MRLNTQTPNPLCDRRPDLLAPAGNWECAKAAVENGADAIYFGLERFNARMRAENFTEADLPDLMAFLHRRGVKGYVTLNTLVFTQELTEAEQYLRSIIVAGVDAVIVQDVGICRLIRHLSPDFPIHASTQMTITSAVGVEFAKNLGCQLVVLAREGSIKELNKIQQQLSDRNLTLPLEVFVHGALCVAYSGQCLTSEALGGRSANRGECAQACRMPYDLISDGKLVDLGDRKYLLSPQDLAGLEVLPELIQTGVTCLKIEGRLKSPEYVATVTRVYRQALERAENREWEIENGKGGDRYQLEMAFSRGLHTGWFEGIDNQALVHARFGKKRGFYLGQVTHIQTDKITLRHPSTQSSLLKPGDGVVFDSGHPEAREEGGRIYTVEQRGQDAILTFGRGNVNWRNVKVGDRVWKTSDPELDKQLRQSYAGDTPKFQRPIHIEVHGAVGQTCVVIARDELGHVVQVESKMPLVEAEKQPLTSERLQEQFARLGNTPFQLGAFTNHICESVMLPVSELNRLRRGLVTQLEKQRSQPKRWELRSSVSWNDLLPSTSTTEDNVSPQEPELIVLVRNLDQLQAALETGITTLYCEFEDPRAYKEAMQMKTGVQAQGSEVRSQKKDKEGDEGEGEDRENRDRAMSSESSSASPSLIPHLFVAPPRITKPGESWILEQVRNCNADGYLIRNYDQLQFFQGDRCIGDFSLNIANPITASYFKQQYGLERLTASYDLNIHQLESLLTNCPSNWFEVTIHQHMPMFHMEHCVFCAFLSEGTDYTNCGRPCEQHEVKLRDRVGIEHILKADAGCRNTVFNGKAQTGAEFIKRLLEIGQRQFRIEFINESPEEVSQTIQRYQQLLQGTISGTKLWQELKLQSQLGVTRGTIQL